MKLNPQKTALVVGAFVAIWHFVWGILVALRWASTLQGWILDLHFLNNPFVIQPFDVTKWLTLMVVTAVTGCIFGYAFAVIWNKISK